MAPCLCCHAAFDQGGDLLERAVLEQPGKQQVTGFEEGQVLLVLDVALRKQPGRLQVQQC